MTEAEREAMEWLDWCLAPGNCTPTVVAHTTTLKAMLAGAGYHVPPKTKEVEVWRVEFAHDGRPCIKQADTEAMAAGFVLELGKRQDLYSHVHLTGPHKQTVPA